MNNILRKMGVDSSWDHILIPILETEDSEKIIKTLNATRKKLPVYPEQEKIFSEFSMPFDDLKVIMMGQDPYPTPGLATGRAFAVPKGQTSPSLDIIKNELFRYTNNFFIDEIFDETLQLWHDQGVMMLNAALTVVGGRPSSHTLLWRTFMSRLIQAISDHKDKILYVFMGKHAQYFNRFIKPHSSLNFFHPIADAYSSKDVYKFERSDFFKKINTSCQILFGSEIQFVNESTK